MTRPRLISIWLIALLTLGFAVSRQQAAARQDLEERFALRVQSAQSFVQSYLQDLIDRGERIGTTRLSGPQPSRAEIERVATTQGFVAAVLLDGDGRALQIFPAAPHLQAADLTLRYKHLRLATTTGRPAVSDVVTSAARGTQVTAIAVPYATPYGRRVFSGAYDLDATPLRTFLDGVHPARSARVAIVDGRGEPVAVGAKGAPESGAGRLRIELPVAGAPWRLVASVEEAELMTPIGGVNTVLPWLVLAALAALGLVTIELVVRRSAAGRELSLARRQAEAAFESAPIGMGLIDVDGRWSRANAPLREMLGDLHPSLLIADDGEPLRALLAGELDSYTLEKHLPGRGTASWCQLSVTLVRDGSGDPGHFIAQVQDVSEPRRLRAELELLATCDPLTGLWNRRRFEEELAHLVGLARRYEETSALLMIDVDHFKPVNDTYGHKVGDDLLSEIARSIAGRVRVTDAVARVGGDEFAVLLRHSTLEDAALVADEIGEAVRAATVVVDGYPVFAGASVGIAVIDEAASDLGEVMVRADVAMYAAKQRRRAAR